MIPGCNQCLSMAAADISRDLEPQRGYLLRVARLQLRDEALAEDVVQETLLAALSGSGFSGKSSLRTWLTGILKHKIVDAIRKKQREPTVASAFGDIDAEMDIEDFDAMFNKRSGWDPVPPRPRGEAPKTLSTSANSSTSWIFASTSCRPTRLAPS